MKVKYFLVALFSPLLLAIYGCGNGGEGLNGGLTVTASATGSVINATATYSNPTHSNLIGVPITFSAQIGNQNSSLGTFNTNNSGSINVTFQSPAFNGTQTVTVIASTGNLSNFSSFTMGGRKLTVTAPPALAFTAAAGTASVPIAIPLNAAFIAVTDPFLTDLSGTTFAITKVVVSTNPNDTLVLASASTTTNTVGIAGFPGATGTMNAPATVGGVDTMTITWTVVDTVTGLTGTGVTTITLTST